MEDEFVIKRIIKSFRMVLEDIFNLTERRDLVKMIFKPGFEDVIHGRVNEYFKKELSVFPEDQKALMTMWDGINYLLEKIESSTPMMKMMLYTVLFSNDDCINEKEIYHIFGD